jgi:hypothetical protein
MLPGDKLEIRGESTTIVIVSVSKFATFAPIENEERDASAEQTTTGTFESMKFVVMLDADAEGAITMSAKNKLFESVACVCASEPTRTLNPSALSSVSTT